MHGCDHFPTYTAFRGINVSGNSHIVRYTDWPVYKDHMKNTNQVLDSYNDFVGELTAASLQATTAHQMSESRSAIDAKYRRLRALRREAERRARITSARHDIKNARSVGPIMH